MRNDTKLASLLPGRTTALAAAAVVAGSLVPVDAQAKFVFPWNHPDLRWNTIETEHFYVHYPVSRKEEGNDHHLDATLSAQRTATVADEMWEPVCSQFDYYLKEKIHIVLLEQSDYLEGFTVPSWDWIVISANPGSYFYRMRGRMEWFSDVLVHEFGHVVSLKQNAFISEGTFGVLVSTLYRDGIRDQDTGAEMFISGSEPFWWSEGVTEYQSDNGGYNWWSNSRDMNIRMSVLEDRLLEPEEMLIAFDHDQWNDAERNYQQGYSFNAYLRQRFGPLAPQAMARVGGQRWRPDWETLLEEVLGVTWEQLYDDWRAYITEMYDEQYAEVIAEGEVVGRELIPAPGGWEYTDPDGRDAWLTQRKIDRETQRERTGGTWDWHPRYSPDGKWFAENARGGLIVRQVPERMQWRLTDEKPGMEAMRTTQLARDMGTVIPMEFGHTYDFVPGRDEVVFTGNEHHMGSPYLPGGHLEGDGYEWKQLYVADLSPRTKKRKHRGVKEEYETLEPKKTLGKRNDRWRYTPVPNTLRGTDPAVNPAGDRIAYLDYDDGTQNLALIDFDGENKELLTEFVHGAYVQGQDWSPDGTQLVFSLFKDQRQDLYIINADGTGMQAINRDAWEDMDAHWATDGRIYFSSDPTGIFNIFAYDLADGHVYQITNVIGGAETPSITPNGDLLYAGYTGHGWKNYGLSRDEFLEKDVTELFAVDVDDEEVAEFLAFQEDNSQWEESTRPYSPFRAISPPTGLPIFRIENDSMTNIGISGGFQFFFNDFLEDHSLFTVGYVGEDPLLLAGYTFSGWYPTIDFMLYHYEAKFDYGYLIDDDDDLSTTDDQEIYEGKQHQFVNSAFVDVMYPLNHRLDVGLTAQWFQYGFKTSSDLDFSPYMVGLETGLTLNYNTVYARYGHLNPRGGRIIDLSLAHGFTDMVYAGYNGYDTDDGQLVDKYQYNRLQLDWAEHIPINGFGIEALDFMRKRKHTFELAFQGGYIDRNVQFQDEFRGGGTHPSYMGTGAIQPNNQFSGYPAFSLSGETMLVLSAGYRFPIVTDLNKKWGPLYVYGLHAQLGGTAGNLWSYRPPDEDEIGAYYYDDWGQRVAWDEGDIQREIPFVDKAYKNGNYMLFDAMAELRLSASLMTMQWNSFFRFAWGFNEITGIVDPNGDDISETTDTGFGNSLSAEVEKPGPRFYVGIGTGW